MKDYTANMARVETSKAYKTPLTKWDRWKIDKAIKRAAKRGLYRIAVRLTNRLKKGDLITVYKNLGYNVEYNDITEMVEISWR